MEFTYSDLVDPSSYETDGLSDGIPLRIHRDTTKENIGATRAQRDWAKLVGPVGIYKGGLSADYSFTGVTIPECLPERLEILSYAIEYMFLCDDVTEKFDQDPKNGKNHHLLEVFGDGALRHSTGPNDLGEKKIQAQILAEMMAIDHERAVTSMKAWAKFVQLASSRQRKIPFTSLEEYLPYRIADAGELVSFATVTFGMALTIPERDMDLCTRFVQPVFAALALTNDLFSWEKERDAADRQGLSHVINAIWVLMREHSIDESNAKNVCREKIKESVAEYVRIVEATSQNLEISLDLRKYIEVLQYSHSGNLVWSMHCPRYHAEASYSDVQLSLMEQGATETLKTE